MASAKTNLKKCPRKNLLKLFQPVVITPRNVIIRRFQLVSKFRRINRHKCTHKLGYAGHHCQLHIQLRFHNLCVGSCYKCPLSFQTQCTNRDHHNWVYYLRLHQFLLQQILLVCLERWNLPWYNEIARTSSGEGSSMIDVQGQSCETFHRQSSRKGNSLERNLRRDHL